MEGFGGLVDRLVQGLIVNLAGSRPEVRALGLQARCFLHSCQRPPHNVWLFSLPSSSQDPSQGCRQGQGSIEPIRPLPNIPPPFQTPPSQHSHSDRALISKTSPPCQPHKPYPCRDPFLWGSALIFVSKEPASCSNKSSKVKCK